MPVYLHPLPEEKVAQIKERWDNLSYARVDLWRKLISDPKPSYKDGRTMISDAERHYQLTKESLSQLLGLVWKVVPQRQEKGKTDMKFDRITKRQIFSGFSLVVRLGLGCLFLWSSLPKIRQPYDFLSSVYNYELVGPRLGVLIAMTLPWAELLVGICLVGGIFVSGALLVSTAMAAMFIFVIASALYRGLPISCGCFSAPGAGAIGYSTLIRSCAILLLSIAAYVSVISLQPLKLSR
jgi:uncharacterized membrane protein YphA (DoxX/SURF4 family)